MQKITTKIRITSQGYFYACFKCIFGWLFKITSENKITFKAPKIASNHSLGSIRCDFKSLAGLDLKSLAIWASKLSWEPLLRTNPSNQLQDTFWEPSWEPSTNREEKTYTTATKRKSFGELFWPQKELSRPVEDTKPYKSQENHIHHRNLSSVNPIFWERKVLHWSRAVYRFSFPIQSPFSNPF